MKLSLQIAAGIVIAALVIMAGIEYSSRRALAEIDAQLAANTAATRERNARREAQWAEAARDAAVANQAARVRELEARMAQSQLEQRRAADWRATYKAPPECASPQDWDAQVACGNHYMRARRAWEAGQRQLPPRL